MGNLCFERSSNKFWGGRKGETCIIKRRRGKNQKETKGIGIFGLNNMNLNYLDELEAKSIYIIRESYRKYGDKLAVLVSWGKDSTTMLYLIRKAFFGKIPIPVMHIDTSYKFKEIYEFRDKLAKDWNFNLLIARNDGALNNGMCPEKGKFECCTALKTEALKQAMMKHGFKALFLAIRRDEHGIRSKERYVSPRDSSFKWNYKDQPAELWQQFNEIKEEELHARIHPMLHWREIDIWRYAKKENIAMMPLYFTGVRKEGFRFRSIGCECCCTPVSSNVKNVDEMLVELDTTKISERSGRSQDKESAYTMQKLRSLGYM